MGQNRRRRCVWKAVYSAAKTLFSRSGICYNDSKSGKDARKGKGGALERGGFPLTHLRRTTVSGYERIHIGRKARGYYADFVDRAVLQ